MKELPVWFERVEGAVLAIGAAALFLALGGGWLKLILLFFLPDLSILTYLLGPRVGAIIYNLFHTLSLPLFGIAIGLMSQSTYWIAGFSLIWIAHIGFDRALGFGLKYPDSFSHTTLGTLKGRLNRKQT
jgi:hypothetical protein